MKQTGHFRSLVGSVYVSNRNFCSAQYSCSKIHCDLRKKLKSARPKFVHLRSAISPPCLTCFPHHQKMELSWIRRKAYCTWFTSAPLNLALNTAPGTEYDPCKSDHPHRACPCRICRVRENRRSAVNWVRPIGKPHPATALIGLAYRTIIPHCVLGNVQACYVSSMREAGAASKLWLRRTQAYLIFVTGATGGARVNFFCPV